MAPPTMTAQAQTQMESQLRASGRRLTPERRLLLRIIERNPHLDAMQIYRLARSESRRIGLATVYRTLSVLRELGIVKASDLGEDHHHYEIRGEDHVHLVCESCGAVIELPCPIGIDEPARAAGFRVRRMRIEVAGLCKACQAAEARSRDNRATPDSRRLA
jgi:Fe2+ or Zn2+ uptake regulation protein